MPCPDDPWGNDWCGGTGRVDGGAGNTTVRLGEVAAWQARLCP
jgi:hypothetical protein